VTSLSKRRSDAKCDQERRRDDVDRPRCFIPARGATRWRTKSMEPDRDSVLRDRCRRPWFRFLTDKRYRGGRSRPAAVLSRHPRRRCRILMLAHGGVGLFRVTPHRAEQGGVRPGSQRQHDGEDNCAKHVTLAEEEARSAPAPGPGANRELPDSQPIPGVSTHTVAEFRRQGVEFLPPVRKALVTR
jgi:hypothetical protein